jgi:hypothetical protein
MSKASRWKGLAYFIIACIAIVIGIVVVGQFIVVQMLKPALEM